MIQKLTYYFFSIKQLSNYITFSFPGITEFQSNCNEFIELINQLANEVEKEKMKTIGTRNLLRSVAKERDAQKQQIQVIKNKNILIY